jgi:hypothetical protein
MVKIIPLGMCCRLFFLLKDLELSKESHMFDWMRSEKFTDILHIITKVVNNDQVIIGEYSLPGNVSLDTTDIFSSHYKVNDFGEIFARRSRRFIDFITNHDILFIREENNDVQITSLQILEFKNLIYKINPRAKFKFMLVTPSTKNKIELQDVHHISHTPNKEVYNNYINEIIETIIS